MFSSPKMPSVPPAEPQPAPVQYTDEDQQKARDDARQKARLAAGVAGTNKTGGQGLTKPANTMKKTALGQ
jgi:hypothetical protein